jgi:hypothetical protein
MKRQKIFVPSGTSSWCTDDLQKLRVLAQSGAPLDVIARSLGRSVSAIRNKASMHGISLAPRKMVRERVATNDCEHGWIES